MDVPVCIPGSILGRVYFDMPLKSNENICNPPSAILGLILSFFRDKISQNPQNFLLITQFRCDVNALEIEKKMVR